MPLLRFLKREQGPTAVEYALVLALIVVACVIAIGALGTSVTKPFKKYSKSACVGQPVRGLGPAHWDQSRWDQRRSA